MRNYLFTNNNLATSKDKVVSFCILVFWSILVILISSQHEVWRDEAHCLYVALSAKNVYNLPFGIKNEGHPLLWYFLLWIFYSIFKTSITLKALGVVIGIASVTVFFLFARLANWFKLLFIFSFLPFYEYTIIARNYGISMLLFFLFAACYSLRRKAPYVIAVILFLLANTNVHSAILSLLLLLLWIYDDLSDGRRIANPKSGYQNILPKLVAFGGFVLCVITVMPDNESIVTTPSLTITVLLNALYSSLVSIGNGYNEIFVAIPAFLRSLLVWLLVVGLLVRPFSALLLFSGAVAFNFFFDIGYPGYLRHQGILWIFILTLYWITAEDLKKSGTESFRITTKLFTSVLYGVIPFVMLIHLAGSYLYVKTDITKEMSSSKAFAEFILQSDELHDAIIIGEPDIRLESLPYYVDNKIFLPRVDRFDTFVKLTKENKETLSMGELYKTARRLQQPYDKPILIALGHFGLDDQKPPYIRTEQYGRTFTWTDKDLDTFLRNTELIAEFKEAYKNERYEVYRLRE